MEQALTPMQKAYRRFISGRPPAVPKNTPVGAVSLAISRRKKLAEILASEEGMKNSRITSTAVVVRPAKPIPGALADTVPVEEGKEGQAISTLETCSAHREFIITGLQFAIQDAGEKRLFAYLIERTPEGIEALAWSCQRQSSGAVRTANN